MTIGQRIAEERKKLGLSQEALGEKLGVSRQAISKWESDASVPEIDKLIVLSKLFSVSVGWLLGVENTPEGSVIAGDVPEQPPSFRQKAYRKFQDRGWLRRFTVRRLGIGLLVLTQLYLCLWVVRSHNMAVDASFQAAIAQNVAESAQNELAALRNSLTAQEATASGTLLSDHSVSIAPEKDSLKGTVTFTAVPHSWQKGVKGYLCITGKGVEAMELPCQWDGAFFRCAAVLDLTKNVQLCFALEYDDGSRQLQLLSVPELENSSYAQPPTVHGSVGGLRYYPKTNLLLLQELLVSFHRLEVYANTAVTWQTQAIVLLADGEEAARYDVFNADTHPQDSNLTDGGTRIYAREKSLNNVVLTGGQTLELVLYAELSNGLSAREVLNRWTVGGDGTLTPIAAEP